jgi:hypothetical protein
VAHRVCRDVTVWVDEVREPVERCIEQPCNWWCLCCNKWLCGIVWLVTTVAGWVVRSVCELVADVVDVVVSVVLGIVDIVVGIFTLNWARVWDGLVRIVSAVVTLAVDLFRIVTLGDLVGYTRDSANKWRLRNHVRDLIDAARRFTPAERASIKEALGVDSGSFGLRMRFSALRGFVRSDSPSGGGLAAGAPTPDLVNFHNDPNPDTRVDLKVLTGFSSTSFWQRGRPQVVGDTGGISEADIDDYLANPRGPQTKQFSVFCMSNGVLDTKLSAAVVKADELGLRLRFDKADVQLTTAAQVRPPADVAPLVSMFTSPPFNRTRGSVNMAGAQADMCLPITLGTFMFSDNSFNGFALNLSQSTCLDGTTTFAGNDITASVHRDRLPDIAFRYVLIHEIGHTFGLCHVEGADRVMFSPRAGSWWRSSLVPEYLWLSGEPGFSHEEAKLVWEYIIGNFSVACLSTRAF